MLRYPADIRTLLYMAVTTGMLVLVRMSDSFSPLLFVGYPFMAVSVLVIAHNQNHHKFNNREGDYTITYRYTEKANLLTLLIYPCVSAFHQQKRIRDYLAKQYRINKSRFWFCISQYVLLVAFLLAVFLLDWKNVLFYVLIPQQLSLYSMLIFN